MVWETDNKKHKPSALWKIASVPSASATNTLPLTCLTGRERRNIHNTWIKKKTVFIIHMAIKALFIGTPLTLNWVQSLWVWWSGGTSSSLPLQNAHTAWGLSAQRCYTPDLEVCVYWVLLYCTVQHIYDFQMGNNNVWEGFKCEFVCVCIY